ncbi:MAG: glycosyltransferase [Oscillochloridaceae bacterium umkhey_bin13]
MEPTRLSLVLRVTTGAERLAQAVNEALAAAARYAPEYELIIVDDGADEAVAAVAGRLAATHQQVALIRHQRPRGYRRSLYDAWGLARGTLIVARDLAGPSGAGSLTRLLEAAPGYAVVLGYREPRPSGVERWLQFLLARLAGTPDLRDPALGLACFRADLREHFHPDGPDGITHATIYAAARRQGLAVTQVAVVPGLASTDPRHQTQRAVLAGGLAALVGGLWLVRKRRR